MTGYNLRDVGGALPWGALLHFVQYLPRTSALSREMDPTTDEERWAQGHATAAILADLYDLLNQMNTNLCAKGRRAAHVKPYPRPWMKGKGERRIGRGAIPIADFEQWWASKRKEADDA